MQTPIECLLPGSALVFELLQPGGGGKKRGRKRAPAIRGWAFMRLRPGSTSWSRYETLQLYKLPVDASFQVRAATPFLCVCAGNE